MKDGQIVAHGQARQILTPELVEQLYQIKVDIKLLESPLHQHQQLVVIPNQFGDPL
jgi:ABC-type cobalamin/Fe3+-siderophores transport system ATPase subunit